MADRAGVKVETLRALEQGSRVSRHRTVRAIAQALSVSPEQLHEEAVAIAGQSPATRTKKSGEYHAFAVPNVRDDDTGGSGQIATRELINLSVYAAQAEKFYGFIDAIGPIEPRANTRTLNRPGLIGGSNS